MEIINARVKVWESHFIPSHSTFKIFKFHSISHNQSHNNQTNKHKYLFNITFQNLEFWDVTNLPHLKWISSSRFEEASKKRLGFGGLPANPLSGEVWGATTLKSKAMVLKKIMYSILWVDGVGLLIFSGITLSLVLSRSGHDLFSQNLVSSQSWWGSSEEWVFISDMSVVNTKKLSEPPGGQQFMASPAGKWPGLNLTVYPTIGNGCL